MPQRILDKQEEQVIRYHHHEFMALSVGETAVKMEIPVRKVYSYLKSIKRKAPQLFPILTAEQFKVYKLLTEENMDYGGVAARLDCTSERVNKIVVQLHNKGFNTDRPKVRRYDNSMDNRVKEKF
jgi:hypothetical protein